MEIKTAESANGLVRTSLADKYKMYKNMHYIVQQTGKAQRTRVIVVEGSFLTLFDIQLVYRLNKMDDVRLSKLYSVTLANSVVARTNKKSAVIKTQDGNFRFSMKSKEDMDELLCDLDQAARTLGCLYTY
ncbi:hypothetical protein EIN_389770 [Entamoeba invadens IP1]|uniref:Uncharacterized protein n=1 Tax=Entamoeba invadens IP1 TaxID=370355 RepID=A0A0A1U590_ENTIV|nr:hypothetical protein EIN_389770 [Entamoeba invadens IP1]ELP89392.1 hypothetical protein EIN_389770 [Entamoeba invadens IP1]|eukprot:XP_004256163.1 hypothetical protein EIN_389770 [Entamoeba invadens IP1]